MEDVDLLVEIFYKYEEAKNAERIEFELEELQGIDEMPQEEKDAKIEEIKDSKRPIVRKPTM